MTVIEFAAPAERMNLNDREHWSKKAEKVRLWKHAALVAAKGARVKFERPVAVQVRFGVPDPGRRRDGHNFAPTVKAIVDGLVNAGVVPDDNTKWLRLDDSTFEKIESKHPLGTVRVTITEQLPEGVCPDCRMHGGHLADCPQRRNTTQAHVASDIEEILAALSKMRKDDPYIGMMCRDTLMGRGYASLNELAVTEPETLRELHEVAVSFLEEAPTERDPAFVRGGPL